MLEKVYDKSAAYYKGCMLGEIEANIRFCRKIINGFKDYDKKEWSQVVAEMKERCKTEEQRDMIEFVDKYKDLSLRYAAEHVLKESEFFHCT